MTDPVAEAYVRLRPNADGFAAAAAKLLGKVNLKLPKLGGGGGEALKAEFASVSAAASHAASEQIADTIRVENEVRSQIAAYQAAAEAAVAGSREQIAATNLAADAEKRLTRSIQTTEASQNKANASAVVSSGRAADSNRKLGGSLLALGAGSAALYGGFQVIKKSFEEIVVGAAQVETQLNVFQYVTSANADQMAAASAKAKQLGQDITLPGVSAADAAQSMLELAKGGLTANQSIDAVTGTLRLATAADTDFGTAAQIVARNLSAFNLSGDQAGRVADLLAGAANAATGSMEDMALGLQQAAAAGKLSHQSIDTTVTALADLAKNGLVGSDAGTSLRVMLLRLIPTTTKAADKMHELGVKILDQRGNLLPLPKILLSYKKSLEGLSGAQRTQALSTIFGQDAIRAASFLIDDAGKKWNNLSKQVTKAGVAQGTAAARTKGLQGSFGALQSNLETIGLSIGQKTNPFIKSLVDSTNEGLAWVTANWPRFAQAITPTIDRVVASVKQNWPQVRDTIVSVLQDVQASVESIVTIVTVLWQRFGGNITSIAKTAFTGVLTNLRGYFRVLSDTFAAFADVLQGNWHGAWDKLKDIAVTAVKTAYSTVRGALSIFKNIGSAIINLIRDGVEAAAKGLQEEVLKVIAAVLNQINRIPTSFKIKGHRVGFANPAGAALEGVKGELSKIGDARQAKEIASAFATNTAAALSAKNRDITQAVEVPVKAAVVKATNAAGDTANQGGKKIGDALGKGLNTGISDTATESILNLQKRLRDAIVETTQKVKDTMIQAQQNLSSIGNNLAQELQQVVENGPLGKMLKRFTDQINRRGAQSQSKQLRQAIVDAQKDLASARGSIVTIGKPNTKQQSDIAKFLKPQRTALASAKAAWTDFTQQTVVAGLQAKQGTDQAAVQKRLSTIVDEFNRGAINSDQFSKRISKLLTGKQHDFAIAGKSLGIVFVREFNDQLAGLLTQAKAIQGGRDKGLPGFLGQGSAPTLVEPVKVLNQQLKVQQDIRDELRRARVRADKAAAKVAAKAAAKAAKASATDLSGLQVGSTT